MRARHALEFHQKGEPPAQDLPEGTEPVELRELADRLRDEPPAAAPRSAGEHARLGADPGRRRPPSPEAERSPSPVRWSWPRSSPSPASSSRSSSPPAVPRRPWPPRPRAPRTPVRARIAELGLPADPGTLELLADRAEQRRSWVADGAAPARRRPPRLGAGEAGHRGPARRPPRTTHRWTTCSRLPVVLPAGRASTQRAATEARGRLETALARAEAAEAAIDQARDRCDSGGAVAAGRRRRGRVSPGRTTRRSPRASGRGTRPAAPGSSRPSAASRSGTSCSRSAAGARWPSGPPSGTTPGAGPTSCWPGSTPTSSPASARTGVPARDARGDRADRRAAGPPGPAALEVRQADVRQRGRGHRGARLPREAELDAGPRPRRGARHHHLLPRRGAGPPLPLDRAGARPAAERRAPRGHHRPLPGRHGRPRDPPGPRPPHRRHPPPGRPPLPRHRRAGVPAAPGGHGRAARHRRGELPAPPRRRDRPLRPRVARRRSSTCSPGWPRTARSCCSPRRPTWSPGPTSTSPTPATGSSALDRPAVPA